MSEIYNVAVIGGGPGGYCAAIRAAQLGLKVVVFEERELGGTCLNRGCVPTKALLERAHFVEDIRKNTLNGFIKESGLFSFKKAVEGKEAVAKKLNSGVEGILKSYGILIVNELASVKTKGKISTKSGKTYKAENIIIATGSKSTLPPVEGLKFSERIIDSEKALSLKKLPKHIVILGGGVIGVEFSNIFKALGSKVTIIEFLDDILYNQDKECVGQLKKAFKAKGIEILTSTKLIKAKEEDKGVIITYEKDGKQNEINATHLLVATGRVPSLSGIDYEALGLELTNKKAINANSCMETNVKGIYAIGDVNGQYQLAYTAYTQAEVAALNCTGKKEKVVLEHIPACIFSFPQYASVGLSEELAKEKGIEYTKGVFPYSASGKALAMEESFGMVKTLVNKKDGKIIGCHIVGANSTELIHTMMVAIKLGATVSDFEVMAFAHPTLSEMLKEALLAGEKMAIHLPKAK